MTAMLNGLRGAVRSIPAERRRALVLPAAALLLVISGIWMSWDASSRRGAQEAGAAATVAAREAIVAMGSYAPDTAEQTLNAARDRLTSPFVEAYNQAVQAVVIPNAKQKRITSTVTVPAAAVVSAGADDAVILAFVDQILVVGADKNAKPTANPSRYRVTMQRVDGRWLLAGFDQI